MDEMLKMLFYIDRRTSVWFDSLLGSIVMVVCFVLDLYRCTCVCLCVSVCFGDTFGCFRLCIVRALGLYRLFYAILELRDAFYYLMTSSKATS